MTLRLSLLSLLLSLAVTAKPQPNIIHLFVDDLGWQDVGCYHRDHHEDEPFYETPNLDEIAERGIRFMRAYSPAVTCAPSRAAYMSGQYTPRNGVYHVNMGGQVPRARSPKHAMVDPYYLGRIQHDSPTIGKELKKAGYTTAHIGKWHISSISGFPTPIQQGFDFSFNENKGDYNDLDVYDPSDPKLANFPGLFAQPKNRLTDAFSDDRFPLLEDDRPYDSMTDLAQRWIHKTTQGDRAFFLNLCPSLVHGPVMTRDKKRLAHYCEKLGISFPTDQGSLSDPKKPGQHNPYYASMVDSVDWIAGQLLKTLKETDDPRNPGHKLIDNTYLLISADNGSAQDLGNWKSADGKLRREKVSDAAPLREGKGWVYEGGCRVPLIICGPEVPAGQVNRTTPVNLIDLFPTFRQIAGMEPNETLGLNGCNILPVIQGKDNPPRHANGEERDTFYLHYPVLNNAFSAIFRGPMKLMLNTAPGTNPAPVVQLFNVEKDLGESENLAEKHPKLTARLLGDLQAWLETHEAGVPYHNPSYQGKGKAPLHAQHSIVPKILETGVEDTTLWASYQTGEQVAQIVEAYLCYTINPGKNEEWFRVSAEITDGKVRCEAPAGMTHGVFYLLDEHHFIIHSQPIPDMTQHKLGAPLSPIMEETFSYAPGLRSLVNVGKEALSGAEKKGTNTEALQAALASAQATLKAPVSAEPYHASIKTLRAEIRRLDIPQASLPELNWFPLGNPNW